MLSAALAASADVHSPMIIMDVAANRDTVTFTWASQLWSVPAAGGTAHRVFNDASEYRNPYYSPDGTRLGFGKSDGDLYVMPAGGGDATRITDHPKLDILQSWAPDGDLVVSSGRERDGSIELYKQGADDPMAMRLPIAAARQGSISPDGLKLAYVPNTFFGTMISRRAYRGGDVGVIRILDLKSLKETKITKDDHNSVYPMWVGEKIYYLSDARGSFNLASYDLATNKTTELTDYVMKGITYASYSSNRIAYVRDGRIYLYDLAAKSSREVPITISNDDLKGSIDERAPRQTALSGYSQWVTLNNDGKSLLLEGRGDIWLKPIEGDAVNLTKTPGVAERLPAMSPDGSMIAYFSDASGEYQLAIRNMASGETKLTSVEPEPTYYREITWSPDSKAIAFSDLRIGLWIADIASGKVQRIDSSEYLAQELWHPTWLGGTLCYSKAARNGVRALWTYVSGGRPQQITDGYTPAELPTAIDSTTLRYLAGATTLNAAGRNVWALQSSIFLAPLVVGQIASVTFSDRAVVSPFSEQMKDVVDLKAGKDGVLFAMTQNWGETPGDMNGPAGMLYRIGATGRKWEKLAGNINGFEISSDGSNLMYIGGRGALFVLPADAPATEGDVNSAGKQVGLAKDMVDLDPPKEWAQIYRDTFHMMRDRFYDSNHHGQDMDELERHYAEYLPNITRRADLNTLLLLAFGEVSISHLRVGGGDMPRPAASPAGAGLLGADWSVSNNRYRIAKIYRQSDVMMTSPLVQPIFGDDVKLGMYLISVDDQAVTADKSLNSFLAGKSGKQVKLVFSANADGSNPISTQVNALQGENSLRMLAWAEENARKVDKMSGGRIGYVYIPGYDQVGYQNILRALFAAKGKDGLVIDQRFNGGGITSDMMIQALKQTPILAYEYPYGNDFMVPAAYVDGPKVLIINEGNGSAAETFGLMFKNEKIGTVVGTRTYGGGIGAGLSGVQLIDGGSVTIPNRAGYNPLTGKWEIENDGIRPDIEVEITPADYAAGRDSQLETAVRIAMEQAKKWKKLQLKRPRPPVHPGGRS